MGDWATGTDDPVRTIENAARTSLRDAARSMSLLTTGVWGRSVCPTAHTASGDVREMTDLWIGAKTAADGYRAVSSLGPSI